MKWAWGIALAVPLLSFELSAQQTQDPLVRAFELERRGSYKLAAEQFRAALKTKPGDASALLGLERSLAPQQQTADMLPEVRAALQENPKGVPLFGVAVRTYAAAGFGDSARRVAERWAELEPGEEGPWRELGNALMAHRDRAGARSAWLGGRAKLGKPDALSAELAQLAAQDGDWPNATREWLAALRRLPGYRSSALLALRQTPEPNRSAVLAEVAHDSSFEARRVEAELRARWGDPVAGFEQLKAALPAAPALAVEALRSFAEALRGLPGPRARVALGRSLEAMAERSSGPQAARARLDAAQAYLDGGDRAAARRMLDGLARDGAGSAGLAQTASATLLRLLIEDGRMEEAENRLKELGATLPAEDRAALSRRIALGWARRGELKRADALAEPDSSVEGFALSGRLRLLRGDLAGAKGLLKAAGPFAGSREASTERTRLLALLTPIEADSLPRLGTAFQALERGDTAQAVVLMAQVGGELPRAKGGAELALFAGELAAARGDATSAERLLRTASDSTAPAIAPQALLALGKLLGQSGRAGEATTILEQLILSYPRSALVPQARRVLDETKGAVPN